MKLAKKISISDRMVNLHLCNNCEKLLDGGIGWCYWKKEDFTLCFICLEGLKKNDK